MDILPSAGRRRAAHTFGACADLVGRLPGGVVPHQDIRLAFAGACGAGGIGPTCPVGTPGMLSRLSGARARGPTNLREITKIGQTDLNARPRPRHVMPCFPHARGPFGDVAPRARGSASSTGRRREGHHVPSWNTRSTLKVQLFVPGRLAALRSQPRRTMTKIAIVTGSVRPGRQSLNVANWVKSIADQRPDAEFEVVDIADFHLPVWDEAMPPSMGQAEKAHSKAWSAKMAEFDGYVFVVSEYNHSITGALKNALDYLYTELNNKATGFVSYGSAGGARAVEHLRGI